MWFGCGVNYVIGNVDHVESLGIAIWAKPKVQVLKSMPVHLSRLTAA